uniref:MORF/ORRM1/DAG-like MORF domain-containing protein n=1 Tax=Kalanchoe fedtschenkoi TaxID=63787 RepID=A0A7N1A6J8_KALFE
MAARFLLRSRARSLLSSSIVSSSHPSVTETISAPSSLRRFQPSAPAPALLRPARRFSASESDAIPPPPAPASIVDGVPRSKDALYETREDIMLDGCDFEHWLIMMDKPEGDPPRDDIIDSYIKTLATVVGSEEEARMKIYSVSTKHYYAFSCLLSQDVAKKLNDVPGVSWVLPDAYVDVRNKDYGGEPFINGKAVPYDPKYHEEWVRNNSRSNKGGGRNRDRAPSSDNRPRRAYRDSPSASDNRPRGENRDRAPTPSENNAVSRTSDGGRAF